MKKAEIKWFSHHLDIFEWLFESTRNNLTPTWSHMCIWHSLRSDSSVLACLRVSRKSLECSVLLCWFASTSEDGWFSRSAFCVGWFPHRPHQTGVRNVWRWERSQGAATFSLHRNHSRAFSVNIPSKWMTDSWMSLSYFFFLFLFFVLRCPCLLWRDNRKKHWGTFHF